MPSISAEFIVGFFSFLFTVMTLSYLIGDNPFFRVAIYTFIGVSAGYVTSLAWHQVLLPKVFLPLINGSLLERISVIIPLLLILLLLAKLFPRISQLGNPAMALLVGVGAAVAIGGAINGTLLPQIQASIAPFNLGNNKNITSHLFFGSIALVGTITTLVYFHFGARLTDTGPRRNKLINSISAIGQVFIAITFGVLFAGVFAAALTAFVERINSLWNFLSSLL